MTMPVIMLSFCNAASTAPRAAVRRKRAEIWNDRSRNAFVANVAERLTRTPRKVLRGYGVKKGEVKWPDRVRQRVVVLAEVYEHAEHLHRLLPAWELRHAVPFDGEPEEVEEDTVPVTPPGVITTLVYAAQHGLSCDVLVRATGGTGKLPWDAIRCGGNRPGTTPAVVIDVADQMSEHARNDAEVRRREYRDQGLKVIAVTPEGQNT